MIKTMTHKISNTEERDKDVNTFHIDHEVFATQTNIYEDNIISTIFYKSKSK